MRSLPLPRPKARQPAARPQPETAARDRTSAAVVITIAIVMASFFAVSYSLALGRPFPHHVPLGRVGRRRADARIVHAFEAGAPGGFSLTPFPSGASARAAIAHQRIYGALVLTPAHPRLLIASAAGTSVARLLEADAAAVTARTGRALEVVDLHPLPPGDPEGLVTFYITLAATILGFVTIFQLRANAPGLPLRAWLAAIGILGAAGGLVLALVADPLIGALHGPFPELWGLLAMQIGVAALFNATMLTLVGRWAMIPTWGLFVALGNAASGGAVAPPLLPPFYAFVGRFLPTGATVEGVRNAVYFATAQPAQPIEVEAVWLAATLTALVITARARGRTPGE